MSIPSGVSKENMKTIVLKNFPTQFNLGRKELLGLKIMTVIVLGLRHSFGVKIESFHCDQSILK